MNDGNNNNTTETGAASRFGKKAVFAAFAAFALAAGAAVFAHGGKERGERFAGHFAEKLDLSDSQRGELENLAKELHAQRKTMREGAREKTRAAIAGDALSRGEVLRIMRMRRELREQFEEFAAGKLAAFHATLNKEQREKAAELVARRHGKHGKGFFHRRDRHGWHGWHGGNGDDDDDDDRDDDRGEY